MRALWLCEINIARHTIFFNFFLKQREESRRVDMLQLQEQHHTCPFRLSAKRKTNGKKKQSDVR